MVVEWLLRRVIDNLGREFDVLLDRSPADGAGVVLFKPGLNAVAVEEVAAGQDPGLFALNHLVDADDAARAAVAITLEHHVVDLLDLEVIDGRLGSRGCAAGCGLVAQLRHDSVVRLLGVDGIAKDGVCRVEVGGIEERHERAQETARDGRIGPKEGRILGEGRLWRSSILGLRLRFLSLMLLGGGIISRGMHMISSGWEELHGNHLRPSSLCEGCEKEGGLHHEMVVHVVGRVAKERAVMAVIVSSVPIGGAINASVVTL